MKKLALFIVLIVTPIISSAKGFYGEFSITNQLLWRGMQWTPTPTIYPTVGYKVAGLNVYTTAAYAFDDSYREWDFVLSYTLGGFKLDVIDYWYPALSSELDPDNPRFDFFNWRNATTGHQIDVILTFAPKAVPIKAMVSVIPFGNDKLENGKNAFSTYAEVGWYHVFANESQLDVNVGASFRESLIYGTKGFSVINTEVKYGKTFDLKKIQFPLSGSFTFNPYLKKPFICISAGVSF